VRLLISGEDAGIIEPVSPFRGCRNPVTGAVVRRWIADTRSWMRLGPIAKSPRRLSPETPLLKELESENARLKRIVADKKLHIEALKELGRGNW
jgi:hypothetical protein